MNNILPVSFNDMFTPLSNLNRTHNFKLEKTSCKYLDSFPKVTLPKTWNNLRLDLKSSKSINSFKRKFQSNALLEYSTFSCQNSRCYSCINKIALEQSPCLVGPVCGFVKLLLVNQSRTQLLFLGENLFD